MSDKYAVLASYAQQMADTGRHVAPFTCQEIIDLLAEREADKARIAGLTDQLCSLFSRVSGESITSYPDGEVSWLADMIEGELDASSGALEKAQQRIIELESRKVKLPQVRLTESESRRREMPWREFELYNEGADAAIKKIAEELRASGITLETGE
ncbi:hypothetical protein ACJY8V_000976 [Escherichia coli]|nr:hypothetical protein [Escherichia coli]EFE3811421.1 hypothetical protein [Escherichia coli]EJF6665627.1 hypothetical protein [Escherichia coli]EJK1952098.1 hypothetical protein [Escherichia coli]HCN8164535.1 hypothetical protein [Escherichia coli]